MSRVPGMLSPSPQPRGSARSPTHRISTTYGGSSACKPPCHHMRLACTQPRRRSNPRSAFKCCPTSGWSGRIRTVHAASFTTLFQYTHRCRLLVSERVTTTATAQETAVEGSLRFAALEITRRRAQVCARPVTIPSTRLTHHRSLHGERVPTQPCQLNRHSSRVRAWLASAEDALDPQALHESTS
jgi:hypothetical protein